MRDERNRTRVVGVRFSEADYQRLLVLTGEANAGARSWERTSASAVAYRVVLRALDEADAVRAARTKNKRKAKAP